MRTTSTSFMTGTGLKKCRPTKRAGREVAMASWVTVSEEVLEAKIAVRLNHLVERRVGRLLLVQVLDDRLDHEVAVGHGLEARVVPWIRPSTTSRSSAVILPFSTALASEPRIRPMPFSSSASETSRTTVSNPAFAAISAIPDPIRPQPRTPTLRMAISSLPLR